jgi:hypothetical protein
MNPLTGCPCHRRQIREPTYCPVALRQKESPAEAGPRPHDSGHSNGRRGSDAGQDGAA